MVITTCRNRTDKSDTSTDRQRHHAVLSQTMEFQNPVDPCPRRLVSLPVSLLNPLLNTTSLCPLCCDLARASGETSEQHKHHEYNAAIEHFQTSFVLLFQFLSDVLFSASLAPSISEDIRTTLSVRPRVDISERLWIFHSDTCTPTSQQADLDCRKCCRPEIAA